MQSVDNIYYELMKELVFASNNKHKLAEVRAILAPFINIISLNDLNCFDEIPETANTLEGNALIKAKYIYDKFGLDCFADDTGLEVEALGGEPGVFSARYAGEANSAVENMNKVLKLLGNNNNRTASFRTVIALIQANNTTFFEGKIEGDISNKPCGKTGFGYDPIFIPKGYSESFAQLSADEKIKISHRALAINNLISFLKIMIG